MPENISDTHTYTNEIKEIQNTQEGKMFKYNCLNNIAKVGLDKFDSNFVAVDDFKDADCALVRSAAMHDMELPDSLLAIARAGAGVNNIPLDKCAEKGIVVFNTPGANANGVKELVIAGKTRRIDLLFYHIYLRCYVVIELKVKPFKPEFAGKLNYYVNAVNDLIRREGDNPTIGLLICKDLEKTDVQYAFEGITTPMGVATYNNVRIVSLREYLPTPEQIQDCITQAEKEYIQLQQERK